MSTSIAKLQSFKVPFEAIGATGFQHVRVSGVAEFWVYRNGTFIGPMERFRNEFEFDMARDDEVEVLSVSEPMLELSAGVGPYEPHSDEKLVEIVDTRELSLYDRLRAELLAKISEQDPELAEEENDLDFIDDDPDILTPYEVQEMKEEWPVEDQANASDESSDSDASESPTSPDLPGHENAGSAEA